MTSRRLSLALCMLLLAACKGPAAPLPRRSVAPTAAAVAVQGATAPAPPAAAVRLSSPGGGAVLLRGMLQLDAARALAEGHASVFTAAGGQLTSKVKLAAEDLAALLAARAAADDGSSLTSKVKLGPMADAALALGGAAVGPDGASLVGAGGAIIANNGGNIVSNNSGNIISNNGGGIVGNNGGNLISDAGGNYRLAWTDGAPAYGLAQAATLPPGLMLPAAGMRVGVESLITHQLLPVGRGADGQPAYEVYSNLAGQYELYLDAAEAHTVRVVALPPGATSPALALDLLDRPAADAGARVVGEASANAMRYIRESFARALANASSGEGKADPDAQFGAIATPLLREFGERAAKLPADQRPAGYQRATDQLLANLDLGKLDTALVGSWAKIVPGTAPLPVLATLVQVFWQVHQLGARGLAADGVDGFNAKLLEAVRRAEEPREPVGYDLVKAKVQSPDDLLRCIALTYLAPRPGETIIPLQVPLRFLLGYAALGADGAPTVFPPDPRYASVDRKAVVKSFDYANFMMEETRACADGLLFGLVQALLEDPLAKPAALDAIAP